MPVNRPYKATPTMLTLFMSTKTKTIFIFAHNWLLNDIALKTCIKICIILPAEVVLAPQIKLIEKDVLCHIRAKKREL